MGLLDQINDAMSLVDDDEHALSLKQEITASIASGYSLSAKQSNEGDADDFLSEENFIAIILAAAMGARAGEISETVFRYGDDLSRLMQSLPEADRVAQSTFTEATEVAVRRWVGVALDKGADKVDARTILSPRAREMLIEGMTRSSKYYTNNYFNRIVMPELISQVDKMMDGRADYGLDTVRETLNKRLKSVPYWRTVANAAASRAYHYGILKGASVSGYAVYEFVAVLDDRTSALCESLNGKQFSVATGAAWAEVMASTNDVGELVELVASPAKDEVDRLSEYSSSKLSDMGLMVPPLHPNCRSSIRLVY